MTGSDKPNVLFIVTDDQRSLKPFEVMPHAKRRFMDGGTHFPQAVATTPICGPSRASIFSGRYAHSHGIHHNPETPTLDQRYTLQRYLRESGYTTAIFGKYLNKWDLAQAPPHFDEWSIFTPAYFPVEVNEQGEQKTIEQYSTRYVADLAVDFIQKASQRQPWFLYIAPWAPHHPWTPEEAYADAPVPPFEPNPDFFPADTRGKHEWVQSTKLNPAAIRDSRIEQLRTLLSVDDLVRNVFDTLERTGQEANTLAAFTSDNGWLWGEHGLTSKANPYSPSIQVPLFVRWPNQVDGGAVDARLAANIDLAPTVLDAVGGISPEIAMDGNSLLDGDQAPERVLTEAWGWLEIAPRFIESFGTFAEMPGWASTRTHSYQYIEYYDVWRQMPGTSKPQDASTVLFREYYDLTTDPWQLTNVLHEGPRDDGPDVDELSRQLAADRNCEGDSCP